MGKNKGFFLLVLENAILQGKTKKWILTAMDRGVVDVLKISMYYVTH